MSKTFLIYQSLRRRISDIPDFQEFNNQAFSKLGECPHEYVGLVREWRAFWYLKSKYKASKVWMSDASDDAKGVDIIVLKPKTSKLPWLLKFAVSGPGDHEEKDPNIINYKLIVTDKKIYQKKVSK